MLRDALPKPRAKSWLVNPPRHRILDPAYKLEILVDKRMYGRPNWLEVENAGSVSDNVEARGFDYLQDRGLYSVDVIHGFRRFLGNFKVSSATNGRATRVIRC